MPSFILQSSRRIADSIKRRQLRRETQIAWQSLAVQYAIFVHAKTLGQSWIKGIRAAEALYN